jgi:hypothetical protein
MKRWLGIVVLCEMIIKEEGSSFRYILILVLSLNRFLGEAYRIK